MSFYYCVFLKCLLSIIFKERKRILSTKFLSPLYQIILIWDGGYGLGWEGHGSLAGIFFLMLLALITSKVGVYLARTFIIWECDPIVPIRTMRPSKNFREFHGPRVGTGIWMRLSTNWGTQNTLIKLKSISILLNFYVTMYIDTPPSTLKRWFKKRIRHWDVFILFFLNQLSIVVWMSSIPLT